MAVLFAVQIIVGGFCLLTSEANAMPPSNQHMHAHCKMSVDVSHVSGDQQHEHAGEGVAHDQGQQDSANNCYHCDQPDQLSSSTTSPVASLTMVLFDDISLSTVALLDQQAVGLLSTRTPTGPPRSASLLYSTSQRILI